MDELFIARLNNNSSLRGENPLHSSAIVIKNLDTVQKLVYPSVGDPRVARLQTHEHIHRVVQIVWLDEAESSELVAFIFESFSRLLRQLSLLVLHLQIRGYSPVVIAPVCYGHKLICVLLEVRVPAGGCDGDRDHGLAENVFVAVEEVPNCEGRRDVIIALLGARGNEQHI